MPDKEIANGKSKELAKYEKNESKKKHFYQLLLQHQINVGRANCSILT